MATGSWSGAIPNGGLWPRSEGRVVTAHADHRAYRGDERFPLAASIHTCA
jgi:hypothetical protein